MPLTLKPSRLFSFIPVRQFFVVAGAVGLWATRRVVQAPVHQVRQIHSLQGFLVDLEERLRYGEKRNFCTP